MERCPKWYAWQTAKTIIQSLGRSVRSVDDSAISYILDEDFRRFFNMNRKMFPDWFASALIFV